MPGLSDAEVFGAAPMGTPAAAAPLRGPITVDNGRGITVSIGGDVAPEEAPPAPAAAPQGLSDADVFGAPAAALQPQPQAAAPGIVDDMVTGFVRPFQAWGHAMMEDQRASLKAPTSPLDALKRMIPDPTILGLPGAAGAAVTGLVTRPVARQLGKVLPQPYSGPSLNIADGKLTVTPSQPLDRTDAAQEMLETALSGARPVLPAGVPFGPRVTLPPAPGLDELAAAKKAAYAKVDQSGFAFPQADVQKLAGDVAAEVSRKAGPSKGKLYPASEAMSDRLTALANQPGGVPLGQLDELRSDIWDALVAPGDRESVMGNMMRQKIDALMDAAQAPHIREARDLNTRYEKVKTVTNKLDSAGLRAASTYSGGNYNNAVRQNLRPLIDPDSAQQIRNLTADEEAALRAAVTGTPVQNATRTATKLLTNKIVQVPFGVLTHGVGNAVMEGIGAVLNKVGQKQTGKAVQAVLDLMAMGGSRPAPPTVASLPQMRAVPVLSGPGAAGVNATLLPLHPTRDQLESVKRSAGTKSKVQAPRP